MKTQSHIYHAVCGEGLSPLVEEEILKSQLTIVSKNRGGIFFTGKKQNIIQFALSTRFSSRINFQLIQEKAQSYDELYEKCKKIAWEQWIATEHSFRIDAQTKDSLGNSQFAVHKLKDAILDRFREKKVPLPNIDKRIADITIVIRSFLDKFSIEISLTGESIGRRGYRVDAGKAPVREPIAQAMLHLGGWKPGELLVDPMCGSGTILIEAALYQKLNGEINRFILEESPTFQLLFPEYEFSQILQTKPKEALFFGYDIDPESIRIAKENAYEAGVEDWILFEVQDVLQLKNSFKKPGFLVTNPPYGERIGKPIDNLREFYFQLGKHLKNYFPAWRLSLLCGEFSLLGKLNMKEESHLPLKHANLKAKIVQYQIRNLTS